MEYQLAMLSNVAHLVFSCGSGQSPIQLAMVPGLQSWDQVRHSHSIKYKCLI